MTEADMIYLFTRLYIRLRLDHVSSNMRPIYHELIDLLSERAGRNVEQTTDSDLVDILRPRDAAPRRDQGGPVSPGVATIVGEPSPETFNHSGEVVPNVAARMDMTVDIDVKQVDSIEQLSDELDRLGKRRNKKH